jgi:hypothetical protein
MKHYLSPKNELFAYELDGSQDDLIPENFTRISDAQVQQIHYQREQDYLDSLTYRDKREVEYPTIKDQLDTLYHGGLDAWKESIKAVKDKYPKS